jgi:hypothetical protein
MVYCVWRMVLFIDAQISGDVMVFTAFSVPCGMCPVSEVFPAFSVQGSCVHCLGIGCRCGVCVCGGGLCELCVDCVWIVSYVGKGVV